jgi:hypothetical protein
MADMTALHCRTRHSEDIPDPGGHYGMPIRDAACIAFQQPQFTPTLILSSDLAPIRGFRAMRGT